MSGFFIFNLHYFYFIHENFKQNKHLMPNPVRHKMLIYKTNGRLPHPQLKNGRFHPHYPPFHQADSSAAPPS